MRNDVRARRTARGLSQGDFGSALGVSRQTVNAIETGRYSPSLPLAIQIARYFDATVEEVFHVDNS
jgi:putative transcriptional regulator